MSKYKIELRHRVQSDETISERHGRFLDRIARLRSPWNLSGIGSLPAIGAELLVGLSFDDLFGPGIKGRLTYVYRSADYLEDNAQYDDSLFIEFKAGDMELDEIVEVFPVYVEAFDAYRATLHNWNVTRSDWPDLVAACRKTGKDLNGRDGVYRINTINYFDRELCSRAFGLTPEQLVARLEGKVQLVSMIHDGVFMVYDSSEMDARDFQGVDSYVRRFLG